MSLRRMLARVLVLALVPTVFATASPGPPVSAAGETAQLPTANPADFTPNVCDGQVESIWQVGNTVIVGGTFTYLTNAGPGDRCGMPAARINRSRLASFNATTGLVNTAFAPNVGGDVSTVVSAADGNSIYIAGDFNTVNGVNKRKVARLDLVSGALVDSFDAGGVDGTVRDMKLVGGELFIGGGFTSVSGQPRSMLASLDASTGVLTNRLNLPISGTWNGGTTNVMKFEVTPDAGRLLMIGNFTSVGGQTRNQIAMLNLAANPATVSPWYTNWFEATCASAFESYMRDVDISEDGKYAIATTTGAYRAFESCDSNTRFEIDNTSPNNAPTWTNWTGGDTSYAVEIYRGVAFIGGHMRWANNPYGSDAPGQGAVPRPGMMALDVVTGLPFSWNPTRERGVGLFDYHITASGIWAGSDTETWNGERRERLAFFPWTGGSLVPASAIGALPGNVVMLGQTGGTTGTDSSVLYRVNAGGPALASADDGPAWTADTSSSSPYRNSGSNTTGYSLTVGTYDTSVPTGDFDRPPAALWNSERWDPVGGTEMQWAFDVPAGTQVQVRLYLGNKATGTDESGQRIFDIDIDGSNVVNNIDLSRSPGHNVGTMRSFNITSDGQVDIAFGHVVVDGEVMENPLVNGIEIIRRNVSPNGSLGEQDSVRTIVGYDGVSAPAAPLDAAGTVPWRHVRGAFMVNSTLFTMHSDGTMMRRTYDGTTFGPGTATPTYANGILSEIPSMTGIFFDPGTSRIYYTLSGQNSLYYRSFLPESRVIGAIRSTATGAIASLTPSRVRGMFLHGGELYFADSSSGDLLKIGFVNGAVTGTAASVDPSPTDWRARAMFLTAIAALNTGPTASFTHSCVANDCAFDASGSADSDGTIADYAWDFGDGQTGSGPGPVHAYPAAGVYTVTLTVTDSDSATAVAQQVVTTSGTPPPPPPPGAGYESLAAPARILDTRADGITVDGQFAGIGARPQGGTIALPVAGRAGVPADADTVVLNVTVTEAAGPGFITVFPCDAPQPTASNLNYVAEQSVPNLVVAKVGADGSVCLFNSEATQIVVDVAGFYPGMDTLVPLVAPARLLDTRADGITSDGLAVAGGIRGAGTTEVLQVGTRAGVPAGTVSVVLNVTVDQPETAGFVTVFPCDAPLPTASNLNYVAGQTVPNAVISRLDASGQVCLFTSATTHLVVDIAGFFPTADVLVPLVAPARLLDTRADGATIDGAFVGGGYRPSGGTLQLTVNGRAGIPAEASAVILNVTVDQPLAPGFVTVYPPEAGRPNASNLNYVAGQTVPNAVIAKVGSGGAVCLFTSGATHLVVDVAGYLVGPLPAGAGAACPPDP